MNMALNLLSMADNPAALANIYARGANPDFQIRMNEAPSAGALAMFNRICPSMASNYIRELFPGLTAMDELRDFNNEISFSDFGAYANSIASAEFGLGIAVTQRQLRADVKNIRKLERLPTLLANQALRKRLSLFRQLLESNLAWEVDAEALFSTTHFFGSNDISVTVSSPTAPAERDVNAIIDAIYSAQAGYVDQKGNVISADYDLSQMIFVVPPSLASAFRRVQRSNLIPRGTDSALAAVDNIDSDTYQLWTFPFLTGSYIYAFFVEPTDGAGNPLGDTSPCVRLEFTPYEITAGGGEDDPVWRVQKVLQTTIYGEEGVGANDATRAIRITLAGA